VQPTPR